MMKREINIAIKIHVLGTVGRRQTMLQYRCYRTDGGRPEKRSVKQKQALVALPFFMEDNAE
jgi:hypothetical protein